MVNIARPRGLPVSTWFGTLMKRSPIWLNSSGAASEQQREDIVPPQLKGRNELIHCRV